MLIVVVQTRGDRMRPGIRVLAEVPLKDCDVGAVTAMECPREMRIGRTNFGERNGEAIGHDKRRKRRRLVYPVL